MKNHRIVTGYMPIVVVCAGLGMTCALTSAAFATGTTSNPNYLQMSPGQVRIFSGGEGTREGDYWCKGSWKDNLAGLIDGQSLSVRLAATTSPLQERVTRFTYCYPYTAAGVTSLGDDTGAKTSGTFKYLVLYRLATGQTKPSGIINLRGDTHLQAWAFYFDPATLKWRLPGDITPTMQSATNHMEDGYYFEPAVQDIKHLQSVDLKDATLVSGESDIYAIEVDGPQVEVDGTSPLGCSVDADASSVAVQDTRGVYLSRDVNDTDHPTREVTKYENGIPVTYGDTMYSFWYHDHDSSGAPYNSHQDITPKIMAKFTGNWTNGADDPNISVAWVPGDSNLTPQTLQKKWSRWLVGDGNMYYQILNPTPGSGWKVPGTKAPTQAIVDYFVADNGDGAQCKARYVLTMHEPIEGVMPTVTQVSTDFYCFASRYGDFDGDPLWRSGPDGAANWPTDSNAQYDPSGQHWDDFSLIRVVGRSDGWPLVGSMEAINEYREPLGVPATINNAHQETVNIDADAPFSLTVPIGYRRYLMMKHTYNRHHLDFRHYEDAGEDTRQRSQYGQTFPIGQEALWDDFASSSTYWSDPILATATAPVNPDPGDSQVDGTVKNTGPSFSGS